MSIRFRPSGAIHLSGDTWYLPGPTNAGLVGTLGIDTAPYESTYEDFLLDALAITHGHADHFASAPQLRERGAKVFAARDDAYLVEKPEVNIRGMFSWAKPTDELVTRLFKGDPCHVDAYVEDLHDPRVTAVPLPGHTLGHTGFLTADKVFFTGDALYITELWERHRLPYSIDPALVTHSLECIRAIDADWIVPGHGRPISRAETSANIDHHLTQIAEVTEFLLDRLRSPRTTEGAVALVSEERSLGDNPAQYWLAVTTVKGFLGSLLDQGRLEFFVHEHAGWWKTVE
ncbi:MAG: MBL fold metallo-hydrolase [Coriobacteriia bacterium]